MEETDSLSEGDVVLPFAELTQMFVDHVTDALQPPAESQVQPRFLSGGYSGCNDSFSVFGFLAFLLALFDLIMELQDDADAAADTTMRSARNLSAREGRAADLLAEQLLPVSAQEHGEGSQQAAAACHSMLRGFLNGVTANDATCAERFLCEGAEEATAAGDFGQVVASIVSRNAAIWVARGRGDQYEGVGEAMQVGVRGESCADKYPKCLDYPSFYRQPSEDDPEPEES
ncbi:hypothetical protein GWK47_052890 [Chionoecetes opilio]|uniref:Uncharacterized protein n=1 Tax=Chionoecetes opilio TaxID=41210 RepID=A0A8J4Y1C0_CHIOP|nr:hypothetical protein GWK47_052890 [Chionoecetes opilio]